MFKIIRFKAWFNQAAMDTVVDVMAQNGVPFLATQISDDLYCVEARLGILEYFKISSAFKKEGMIII